MYKLISIPCKIIHMNSQNLLPFRIQVKQYTCLTSCRRILSSGTRGTISTYTIRYKSFNWQRDKMEPNKFHTCYGGEYQIHNMSSFPEQNGYSRVPVFRRDFEKAYSKPDDENNFTFTVLSYNVLAQYLLETHSYLYTGCDDKALNWDTRFNLIFNEIQTIKPDIICLQEVQLPHVQGYFKIFQNHGYKGVFKWKTGSRIDGLAIYYKHNTFSLIESLSVEYFQPRIPILNRDNVGLLVKLKPTMEGYSPFVVATTHLLYNPKRNDVRLAQLKLLLAEIDRFSYVSSNKQPSYYPIILTGDLNSTPESPVINLLDNGFVKNVASPGQEDWKQLGITDKCQHLSIHVDRYKGYLLTDPNSLKLFNINVTYEMDVEYDFLFNSNYITHPLKLKSVYSNTDEVPKATTYQNQWVVVDYIYYSADSPLKLKKRLRLPSVDECNKMGPLPNLTYGSDHLCLAATFELPKMPLKPTESSSSSHTSTSRDTSSSHHSRTYIIDGE